MERKELHLVYNEKTGSDMYDVAEADAVMDAMEAKIAKLDDAFESCKTNLESEKATNEELQNRIKALKSANEYLENKNSELIEENYTMVARIKELEKDNAMYRKIVNENSLRAKIDLWEKDIKELEYQLSDKGRKNSELFATNAELRNRIKELEAKLTLTAELVDSAKEHLAHCEELGTQLGTQLGTDHFVDANKMMWVSVKDRLPKEDDEGTDFLVTNGILCVVCEWRGYWNNDPFCGDKTCDEVTHWMPLPNPPENKAH